MKFAQSNVAVSGKLRADAPNPVSAEDLWHIGSVTKPMTATLLAILQDAGDLDLAEPIADLLPNLKMHPGWRRVTLQHLLTHSSGLPANLRLSWGTKDPESDQERQALRGRYLGRALAKPPGAKLGERFRYSNLGYTLAGYCAEVRMQQPFRRLMQDRLWTHLGMHSAGFGPPLSQPGREQPLGHRAILRWRFPQDPDQRQVDNNSIMDPAGCVHMSLQDLLGFGAAHLAGRWPQLRVPALADYACGWVLGSPLPRPYPLVWHNGSNTLWYCLLVLAPSQGAVIALTTNDGASRKVERGFFRLAYGWLDRLPTRHDDYAEPVL